LRHRVAPFFPPFLTLRLLGQIPPFWMMMMMMMMTVGDKSSFFFGTHFQKRPVDFEGGGFLLFSASWNWKKKIDLSLVFPVKKYPDIKSSLALCVLFYSSFELLETLFCFQ
jgi:hypothetical protein